MQVVAKLFEICFHRKNGQLSAPSEPGLGVEPLWEVLGEPVVDVSAPL